MSIWNKFISIFRKDTEIDTPLPQSIDKRKSLDAQYRAIESMLIRAGFKTRGEVLEHYLNEGNVRGIADKRAKILFEDLYYASEKEWATLFPNIPSTPITIENPLSQEEVAVLLLLSGCNDAGKVYTENPLTDEQIADKLGIYLREMRHVAIYGSIKLLNLASMEEAGELDITGFNQLDLLRNAHYWVIRRSPILDINNSIGDDGA